STIAAHKPTQSRLMSRPFRAAGAPYGRPVAHGRGPRPVWAIFATDCAAKSGFVDACACSVGSSFFVSAVGGGIGPARPKAGRDNPCPGPGGKGGSGTPGPGRDLEGELERTWKITPLRPAPGKSGSWKQGHRS